MVRGRLVSLRQARGATSEHSASPGLARSAYHFDLALRLLVAAVYLAVLPLFAFAWGMSAFTRCTDCWPSHAAQAYVLIPIVGALCGLTRLRQRPSPLGLDVERATLAFTAGLGASALGSISWLIYAALGENLPYPSLADVGYLGALILWLVAIFFVYRSQDVTLVGELGPLAPLSSATMLVVVTVVLFVTRDLQLSATSLAGTLDIGKVTLNIAYPILGILNCALLVALLTGPVFETLNDGMKKAVLCLALGMLFNLLADVGFAVSTTLTVKGLGGPPLAWAGNLEDWLYATGLTLVSVGMLFLSGDPARRAEDAVEPESRSGN